MERDLSALMLDPGEFQEAAWIEVVRKMDEVYSDLIRYEVDLEEKNAALEQAQQFITSVLASVSDVLIVCDQRGRVQQVNQAALDITGLSEADLIGGPLNQLVGQGWEKLSARLNGEGRSRECEIRLRAVGGELTDPVAVNCSTRYDQAKRPAGTVLIGRPVGELRRAYEALHRAHAELKQAQQQLIQAEKMASLGRLVAGVAHELNNPISFIYGNVHTLGRYRQRLQTYLEAVHAQAPAAEQAELRKRLKIDHLLADLDPLIEGTLEGAQRVAEIVKNLRRLSFVHPGDRGEVDVADLVRTAVHWVTKGCKQTIDCRVNLPAKLLVMGHVGPLHQVMVNLVQNAVDAMEGAAVARLDVDAEQAGGMVTLSFRDSGPGIPEDALLKVFDPFFTTKPVGKGTGLGLWISYSIIRDHGGSLEAGNHPDGGALFQVTLPV